jgi:hypothetical protein
VHKNGDPTNFEKCKCSFSFNCKSPGIKFVSISVLNQIRSELSNAQFTHDMLWILVEKKTKWIIKTDNFDRMVPTRSISVHFQSLLFPFIFISSSCTWIKNENISEHYSRSTHLIQR